VAGRRTIGATGDPARIPIASAGCARRTSPPVQAVPVEHAARPGIRAMEDDRISLPARFDVNIGATH